MENFPLSRYKFVITNNKVIAISSYCGKIVKGVAKVNPADEMDVEFGKKLAAARCNAKVAKKRAKRANDKIVAAQANLEKARDFYTKMNSYYNDANKALALANIEIKKLVDSTN